MKAIGLGAASLAIPACASIAKPQPGGKLNFVFILVDDAVGKVISAIDESGIAEKTIVFFTSDDGGLLGITSNTPLRSGKGYPYEGGTREPVIVRWPKVIQAGTVSHESVTSIDYFPTICEAAGVPLPPDRDIDGVSLLGHLKSNGDKKAGS